MSNSLSLTKLTAISVENKQMMKQVKKAICSC